MFSYILSLCYANVITKFYRSKHFPDVLLITKFNRSKFFLVVSLISKGP